MPHSVANVASLSRSCEELGHGTEAVLRSSEDTSFSISSSTSSGQGENLVTSNMSLDPARGRSPLGVDADHFPLVQRGQKERERSPHLSLIHI